MKIFVLDDNQERHDIYVRRYPEHWFQHAFNVLQARQLLAAEVFDVAFLDHDLGDWYKVQAPDGGDTLVERTGMDVVRFIVDELPRDRWPKKIIVHTWNGVAGSRMLAVLKEQGVDVRYIPFSIT